MGAYYLDLKTTDPYYNLAMEQYLFDHAENGRTYFMLWQNDNAIIVGKHQNTAAEINEVVVRERGICVARRLSGGGAVYHDLGNLNYTFIGPAPDPPYIDFRPFCEPIIRTLQSLGVSAVLTGRNDITIDGKKISGNSQYQRQGRVLHHGTILFDSDLSIVSKALQVDADKIHTKGIASVRSRVTNVREHLPTQIMLEDFRSILRDHIIREYQSLPMTLTQEALDAVVRLRDDRYTKWEWNYGSSPECTLMKRRRIEGCGLIEIYMSIESGLIKQLTFKGDFFSSHEPEKLAERFVDHRADFEGIASALQGVDAASFISGLNNQALISILCGS